MTADAGPRRRDAWVVDDDLGLDFIASNDAPSPSRGRFSRCGNAFIEKLGKADRSTYNVWIAVRTCDVDRDDLFGRYTGPSPDGADPGVALLECWFPGTTAAGHRYNPRARWYLRCRVGLTDFTEAKRSTAHLIRSYTDAR